MGIIIFNGKSSEDLHILVQHPPEYAIPERDCEVTHIPGRIGDLVVEKGSWANVERVYKLGIDAREDAYADVASLVAQWLHTASGYARLEDSYEPDYFRMAMYTGQINISNIYNQAGEFDATFNCKPQRFLKSGEKPVRFDSNGKLRNPTSFSSEPIIKLTGYGTGNVKIGSYSFQTVNMVSGLIMDCDLEDAYYGQKNCNSQIILDEFPKLDPGDNEITFSGGVTSVEIIPRWWTL